MGHTVTAIYERGVLTPLEPLDLSEHQRVTITIHGPAAAGPDGTLEAWERVYHGLSEAEVSEIESIALDRSRFMRPET